MGKLKLTGFLILFAFVTRHDAFATITVNLPEPAPQYSIGDTQFTLYQAGGAKAAPSPGYMDTLKGFRYIKTSDPSAIENTENLIYIDVFTNKTFTVTGSQRLVVMLSVDGTTDNAIPLVRAGVRQAGIPAVTSELCVGGSNCQSLWTDSRFYSASITSGTTVRLAVSLVGLCTPAAATSQSLCGAGRLDYASIDAATTAATLSYSMRVNIGVVPDTSQTNARLILESGQTTQPNLQLETQTFSLNVSDVAPTVDCSGIVTEDQFYFPGDKQIFLKVGNLSGSAGLGAPLNKYLFLGKQGATPAPPPLGLEVPGSDVIGYTPTTGNEQKVTDDNFINTTDGVDNAYIPIVHAVNWSGIISDAVTSCAPDPTTVFSGTPGSQGVRTQSISGVLTESKCFIATAAYQDGRVAPVMMLRKFRDQILSKYGWGQKFIETYYEHSPAWAEWAWDKPLVRSLALKLLTPLELAAWVTLKISGAEQVDVANPSATEPYIDRLRRSLPPEQPSTTGSYSEELRKNLDARPAEQQPTSSENYAEKELQKLKSDPEAKPFDPHEGYSEKIRTALPPEAQHANPSELIKEGKDRKLGYGEVPPIKNAISLRMGVSPGMEVTVNGARAENSFANIYGEGWQPELLIQFERQLFHSENFGSFGLTAEAGVSYAEGFGRLQFAFAGSTESHTKFSFFQIPVLVGANYRFNLLRILRPYVGAGVGTMLYGEIRGDERSGHRGYAFIYDGRGGVSLLLDFLDPDTARDSFLSLGIQHAYLFGEYFYLNTLGGNVTFARSGIYAGFLFEL